MHMTRTRRRGFMARLRSASASLARDRSGLALLEFGLALPIVLVLGLYGVETANLALINLKISQIALALADNSSRVGTTLSLQELREVDMNDVLQAARYQGAGIDLTTNGRIIVSSLENQTGTQMIHWQRCIGMKSGVGYDSSYGTTSPTAGTDATAANAGTAAPNGMGDPGSMVNAPTGSGVMFVEINYLYQPLLGTWLMPATRIHYIATFIVRDPRDFSQIFNPSPTAARATCNLYGT
jgi:hypothetical protein